VASSEQITDGGYGRIILSTSRQIPILSVMNVFRFSSFYIVTIKMTNKYILLEQY